MKLKKVVIVLIILLLVLIIYFCIEKNKTINVPLKKFTPFSSNSLLIETNSSFIISENLPTIEGASAFYPFAANLVQTIYNEKEYEEGLVKMVSTSETFNDLISGKTDIAIVTYPSEEQKNMIDNSNVELEYIPLFKEPLAILVNKSNPISNLSIEQIQDIYSGKITNWKDVGGEDNEIRAFQRPVNSGSQTGMLSLVMKDKTLMEPPKEDLIETMEAIVNLVSDYDNGLNSIGYSYYYYATTMFDTIDSTVRDRIKFIAVNGIEPNNETIKSHEYPLYTNYYIVIRKDEPEGSQVRKMIDAMLSDRGQAVAEEVGYVGIK